MSDIGSDVEEYRLNHVNSYKLKTVSTIIDTNKPSPVIDFLSGTAAGISICVTGHPLDTLKVRLQTTSLNTTNNITTHSNMINLLRYTIVNEGVTGLYKGLSSPLCTVPLVNAIVFTSYEYSKRLCTQYNNKYYSNNNSISNNIDLSMNQIALCGGISGLFNCIIACPVELIKNKLQVQYESNKHQRIYSSPIDCINKTIHIQGIKGLYTGMISTIYREIPAYTAQFYCYELAKKHMIQYNNSNQLSNIQQLLCGGIGGV